MLKHRFRIVAAFFIALATFTTFKMMPAQAASQAKVNAITIDTIAPVSTSSFPFSQVLGGQIKFDKNTNACKLTDFSIVATKVGGSAVGVVSTSNPSKDFIWSCQPAVINWSTSWLVSAEGIYTVTVSASTGSETITASTESVVVSTAVPVPTPTSTPVVDPTPTSTPTSTPVIDEPAPTSTPVIDNPTPTSTPTTTPVVDEPTPTSTPIFDEPTPTSTPTTTPDNSDSSTTTEPIILSNDASLTTLSVDGVPLTLEANVWDYVYNVSSTTSSVPVVAAVAAHNAATVTVVPAVSLFSTTTISVVAEDATTTALYTVYFGVISQSVDVVVDTTTTTSTVSTTTTTVSTPTSSVRSRSSGPIYWPAPAASESEVVVSAPVQTVTTSILAVATPPAASTAVAVEEPQLVVPVVVQDNAPNTSVEPVASAAQLVPVVRPVRTVRSSVQRVAAAPVSNSEVLGVKIEAPEVSVSSSESVVTTSLPVAEQPVAEAVVEKTQVSPIAKSSSRSIAIITSLVALVGGALFFFIKRV